MINLRSEISEGALSVMSFKVPCREIFGLALLKFPLRRGPYLGVPNE
jgi:hypothetical protein